MMLLYNNNMKKNKIYFFLVLVFSIFLCFFSSKNSSSLNSNGYIYPTITQSISSYFGNREIFGKANFHTGIDFPVPEHTPVFSTSDGTVISASFIRGYGNSVIIEHPDGSKALYAHLSENYIVKIGQTVLQGDKIATVGPKYLSNGILNGLTTGPHLHFTIYNKNGNLIDPLSLNLRKK